jgi:hypothetical protein
LAQSASVSISEKVAAGPLVAPGLCTVTLTVVVAGAAALAVAGSSVTVTSPVASTISAETTSESGR